MAYEDSPEGNPVAKSFSYKYLIYNAQERLEQFEQSINFTKNKIVVNGKSVALTDISPITHPIKLQLKSRNLIPPYTATHSATQNNVTYSCSMGEATITLNGYCSGAGGGRNTLRDKAGVFTVTKGKTYTLTEKLISGSVDGRYDVYISDWADSSSISAVGSTNPDGYKTFTADRDASCYVGINVYNGVTYDNAVIGFKLEEGNTPTEYTPYITDFSGVQIKRYGETEAENLITYTANADGTVDNLLSVYPITTIEPDASAIIDTVEYSKDLGVVLDGKLNTITYTPTSNVVPTIQANTREQSWAQLGFSATPYTIPQRSTNGEVAVGTPSADNHATTKKYVDDAVANAGGGLYYHQVHVGLEDHYIDCGEDQFEYYGYLEFQMYTSSSEQITFDYLCSNNLSFTASGEYYDTEVVSVQFGKESWGTKSSYVSVCYNRMSDQYYIYDSTASIEDRVIKV